MFLSSIIVIGALLSERSRYLQRQVNIAFFLLIQGYVSCISSYLSLVFAFLNLYSLNTWL
jgi:hypothetical protein